MTQYEFHEAANIFPMDEEHIPELQGSIEANGQLEPILLYNGKILDGRRRYTACTRAGIEPKYRTVSPDDPIGYVLSLNLHRRQLTESQRGMIGARARELYEAAAKDRMRAGGGDKKSTAAKSGVSNGSHPIRLGKTRDHAGAAVNVSGQTIDRATRVLNDKNSTPELIAAVDTGVMSVNAADMLRTEAPEVQREAAADIDAFFAKRRKDRNGHADQDTRELKGVGVFIANEAINVLKRIPKNDALRAEGFKIVARWMRANG